MLLLIPESSAMSSNVAQLENEKKISEICKNVYSAQQILLENTVLVGFFVCLIDCFCFFKYYLLLPDVLKVCVSPESKHHSFIKILLFYSSIV